MDATILQQVLEEAQKKVLSTTVSNINLITLDAVKKEIDDINLKITDVFEWDRVISRAMMNAYAKGVFDGVRLYDIELNKLP